MTDAGYTPTCFIFSQVPPKENKPNEQVAPRSHRGPDHQLIEQHFRENTRIDKDGAFIVRIPFRPGDLKNLSDNQDIAYSRFMKLEHDMSKDYNLANEYKKAMTNEIINGYLEEIPSHEARVFVPHHGGWKDSTTTTKLWPVWDFSAKKPGKYSLNDVCMVGPTIQLSLSLKYHVEVPGGKIRSVG